MPAAAATQPPKRRVLGGISTTPVGGPSSSSASSTSPNPTRVLRPTSSTAQYRPPSSQGRPLSTSTLSPPSASSASSPRIRAKVDLANIVSSSSSPASHAPTSSGRSSPFKQQQQQQQQARTPIRRTGSTASIPSSQHGAHQQTTPRIHLSGTNVAAPSSPISTRSNSIVSNNNPGASSSSSSYLTGPPSPNVTIRAKHRNQSIDLGSTSSSSLAASARLPISLQPSSKNAPPSPHSHRRISSSSIVTAPTPFPPSQSLTKDHHHQNSISPPSSSVSSSASSSRRAHVIIGPSSTAAGGGAGNGAIKVHSPTLAEHPPPSISLATPYESPVMRYETLPSTNAYDFSSPKSGHISPTSSSTSHDPFFPRQRGSSSSLTTPSHIANLPSITHELQQQHDQHQQQQQATEAKHDPEVEARVAAAVAAIDAKKERKMLDLEITNKSLLAINANLEKERLKMSKEMRELRRRTAIAAAAAAAGGGAGALGSSSFGSGIGGFIALLRGGRKHSADGSEVGGSVDGVGALSADDPGGLAAELGAPLENDEEYWLHAAMAELTDDEDGPSDDEDGSVRIDDDEDRDPEGDDGDGFPLDGEDDDGDDIVTAGGSAFDDRRQRARQRALAERKVAQLVRDWQKLDAAHTRCRSLVEDMLLRGRLACKLSLGPDQEEIVEEVRREEEAAEEERRKLMEMEMKRGTRVLHPVEMEERREAEKRERENAVAAAAAAMSTTAVTEAGAGTAVGGPVEGSAEQADLSTESQTDSAASGDTSVGTTGSNASSSTSTSSSSSLPPPTLVLPDDGEAEEEHTDAELDNSDARSDISSKTERAPEALDEGDLSSGSARVGDGASAADISVD